MYCLDICVYLIAYNFRFKWLYYNPLPIPCSQRVVLLIWATHRPTTPWLAYAIYTIKHISILSWHYLNEEYIKNIDFIIIVINGHFEPVFTYHCNKSLWFLYVLYRNMVILCIDLDAFLPHLRKHIHCRHDRWVPLFGIGITTRKYNKSVIDSVSCSFLSCRNARWI